ncbi:MAG TPA: hypothetical protein VGX00_02300, partial [Thermoplasmata archaeon]|nr:hypothetical protein [Thermoplasmata archaeon]
TKYPSAWDPAITSLGNGTLVLAYIQYNASAPFIPPLLNSTAPPLSRLVVSESYTGGSTWTLPKVVNVSRPDPSLTVSFAPVRPSITAYGKTVYLTWMNLGSIVVPTVVSHVAMVVSTTGGKSWSPTITLGSASSYSANPNVLVNPKTGELFVAYVTGVTYCGYNAYCQWSTAAGTPYTGEVVVASSTYNGTSFSTSYVDTYVYLNETFGPFFNPAPLLSWGSQDAVVDLAFVGGVTTTGGSITGHPLPYGALTPDLFFFSATSPFSFYSESFGDNFAIFNPNNLWGGLANSTQIIDIGMEAKFTSNVHIEATVFNGSACVSSYCGAEETVVVNTSDDGNTWSAPWAITGAISTNGTSGGWSAYLSGEYESAIAVGPTTIYAWDAPSCPSWSAAKPVALAQCGHFTGAGGTPVWTLWGSTNIELSSLSAGAGAPETFSAIQTVPANATWGLDIMGGFFEANGSANITITNVPLNAPMLFNSTAPGLWMGSAYYTGGKANVATPYTFTASNAPLVTFTFEELVPLVVSLTPTWLAGHNCYAAYSGCPLYTPPPGPDANSLNPYNCYFTYCSNPPAGASSNTAGDLGCSSSIYPDTFSQNYLFYEFEGNGCINGFVQGTSSTGTVTNITYGLQTWIPVGASYSLSPAYWSPLTTMCDATASVPIPSYLMAYSYWDFEQYCYQNYFVELTPQAWLGNGTGSVTSLSTTIKVTPTGAVNESIDWNISGWCSGSYAYGFAYGSYTSVSYYYSYNNTVCHPGNPIGSPASSGGVPVPLSVNETGLPKGTSWGVQLTTGGSTPVSKTSKAPVMTFSLSSGSTYSVNVLTVPIGSTGQYWVGTTNATVTMPDFAGITVKFTKQSLAGYSFPATVTEYGLPQGTGWSLWLTNQGTSTTTTITQPPGPLSGLPIGLSLKGGSTYALNGSDISTSGGVKYFVSSVNVTVDSINASQTSLPPWKQTLTATGPATVNLTYSPAYYVTVEATAGGTVSGSSRYVANGSSLSLTATAQSGYTFIGWVGTGSGSSTTKAFTVLVKPTGPVSEFAVFRQDLKPTWTLDVQGTGGLPSTQNYSVTIDGVTH